MTAGPFLGMLYAVLFAAGISLSVSLVVFPASSNKLLAQQLIDVLGLTSDLLLTTLHLFQVDTRSISTIKEYRTLGERVIQLRRKISIDVQNLRPAYEDARYELTFALFPLEKYEAFIDLSTKLQNILVSRMGLKLSNRGHDIELSAVPDFELSDNKDKPAYLRSLVDELGTMNILALHTIRNALANSSNLPVKSLLETDGSTDHNAAVFAQLHEHFRVAELENLRVRLDGIVDTFRIGIVEALDSALHESNKNGHQTHNLFRSNVST